MDVALIGSIVAVVAAITGIWFNKRQADNQSKEVINKAVLAASEIIDDYRAEVAALRQEIQDQRERYEKQLDELRKGREKDKQVILRFQWQIAQMTERITALETENEMLEQELKRLKDER